MTNCLRHVPLILVLAAVPSFVGCSRDFWDRSPRVAGEIERVPQAGQPLSSGDLLPPPAARAGVLAGQPGAAPARPAYDPSPVLNGSPDGPATTLVSRSPAGSDAPTAQDLQVLAEVNSLRALHSLPAIRFDPRLFRAARAHSAEQIASNYLGHGSPDPERSKLSQRLTQGGYLGRMYAEVVASNYGDVSSVVSAWMESPTHRAVLLDPDLSEGAFSRYDLAGDPRVNRWTGDFGAPVLARATAVLPPQTPRVSAYSTPPNPAPTGTATAPRRLPAPPSGVPAAGVAAVAGVAALPAPRASSSSYPKPAPVAFGSDSSMGNVVPPPAAAAAPRAPLVPYVAPRVPQPVYMAPPPVPYVPVQYPARRTVRRVGDCAT